MQPSAICRQPTRADRLWFNCCRTAVGVVVLGLTALATIGSATPLLAESTFATPPEHAYNWTLWTSADSEAMHTILLISGGQLLLVGAVAACCWVRYRRNQEGLSEARAARKERSDNERARTKKRAKREGDKASGRKGELPVEAEPS